MPFNANHKSITCIYQAVMQKCKRFGKNNAISCLPTDAGEPLELVICLLVAGIVELCSVHRPTGSECMASDQLEAHPVLHKYKYVHNASQSTGSLVLCESPFLISYDMLKIFECRRGIFKSLS
ncbi:unnamed protein product [Ixodes persulcatus]